LEPVPKTLVTAASVTDGEMVVHQVAAKVKKSLVFIVINPTFL
jgi:hypothetical protein